MRLGIVKLALTTIAAGIASVVLASGASAATLDCTVSCNQLFAGAYFISVNTASTGSGVINSFVRLSGNADVIDGHNTGGRPLANDENTSRTFTRNLTLADVPILKIAGVLYYEFLLDINQSASDPIYSMNSVQICTSASADLVEANNCPNTGVNTGVGTLRYSMGAYNNGAVNNVKMDYNLNSGSGSGDLFMYIPVTTLGVDLNQYVYLYSQFGLPAPDGNNGGFEEWAVRICGNSYGGQTLICLPPTSHVPEPSSMILMGTGLAGLAAVIRRRARASAARA